MKNLFAQNFDFENSCGRKVFLLDNVKLRGMEEPTTPLIDGEQGAANGSLPEDNVKNFETRINDVIRQGVDNTTSAALTGSRLARVMTPPEFENFGLYALNPFFAFPAGFTPVRVLGQQIQEGFDRIGDVASLLGDSPQLSVKMAKALAGGKAIDASIKGMKSGGGHLSEMTLTSINLLTETVDESYAQIQATNEDRAVEFFARSGQNLETGERDEEVGVVWWKRLGMYVTAQRPLYRLRYRTAKARYKEGYDEARSNLRKIKRQKEEQIFGLQQRVDQFIFPAEGAADTEKLNAGRKVIHKIINDPERFLTSPNSFSVDGVSPEDIFGNRFSMVDVVETLRAPKYEYLTNREDETNYLDSAITTNNWKLNYYNMERNLQGLKARRDALNRFEGTSLKKLENHVNVVYEPSGKPKISENLENPEALVNRLKTALGSATPGLRKEVQELIFSDIYTGNMEVFWHLAKYLGENLAVFDKLPKDLQEDFSEFFLRKREELEKPLVSGSITEKGTKIWRAQVLRQGKNVIQSVKNVANLLPEIGNKLLSFEKGEAQGALQDLKSVMDSYKFLNDVLGAKGDETVEQRETLLKNLPELEQGLLKNIFSMEPFIKRLGDEIYPNLKTQREAFQSQLDVVTSEGMEKLKEDYDTAQGVYQKAIESGKSGFEKAGTTFDLSQFGGRGQGLGQGAGAGVGDGDGGGFMAGVDIETIPTTAQRNYAQLRDLLYGKTGTEEKGLIGQLNQVLNYTYDLPGDISGNILDIAHQSESLLTSRLREIGVSETGEEMLDNLKDARRDIDFLARLDLGDRASRDIETTARALLANSTVQQVENMKRAKYGELETFSYMPADFQSRLTVQGVCNYRTIKDALYVREDADGSVWYHSKTQIFKVALPRFSSKLEVDERNVQIWDKHPAERGYGLFTVPQTNPHLGIMINSNPENVAAKDNPYYGVVDKKIKDLPSNGSTDN